MNVCSPNNINSQPLVSIIVATYRRDSALEKALLSLTNQTYGSIEIIVVDDNADDMWNKKVAAIISDILSQFPRQIIYEQNEKNKGSAETRNIGVRRASGEYITFLDDDDVYLPNKVKNQVKHMIKEDSDYSITDLYLYDENDRLIEKRIRNFIKKNNKEDLLRYHLMYHMTGTDTLMFKKDYLLYIGCFESIDVGDEYYLMQKAIEAGGKFSYLPVCDIKAYVHMNTDGLSSGEGKINGENKLYQNKKKYFNILSSSDRRYVEMRHNAVLAFAEFRRKKIGCCIKYLMRSFFASPIHCTRLFLQRK